MSTLNVLRLTMRGCDLMALANLFLVFPVMQVRLRVGWGVVVRQRISISPILLLRRGQVCVYVFLSDWRPELAAARCFQHPGERSSLKVLSPWVGRSWTFWQLPSATLSRQSSGRGQGWNEKGFGSRWREMKVAKTLPSFLLWINFPRL